MCHVSLLWCHTVDSLLATEKEGPRQLSFPLLAVLSPLQPTPHLPQCCWSCAGSSREPGSLHRNWGEWDWCLEAFPAESIPKEKSWKGREHEVGRLSEARCLICLVRWKPARIMCLTVKRENNPHAKPVRVALGLKKDLLHFYTCIQCI